MNRKLQTVEITDARNGKVKTIKVHPSRVFDCINHHRRLWWVSSARVA